MEFTVEDRSIPQLKEDELLIRVSYCGVCGSDLHAATHAKGYEFVPFPIVFGHEFSGIVTEVGSTNYNELLNKRVMVLPALICGECDLCKSGRENICVNTSNIVGLMLDGGMAEYVKVHRKQIIEIPKNLPLDVAALTEPLSVGTHAASLIGEKLKNKKVLVQGPGVIGLFTAIVAKNKGADVTISGLQAEKASRLSHAESFNINIEIYEEDYEKPMDFDYIFECSGSSVATEEAVLRLKKGGTMILVALYEQDVNFPMNVLVRSEIDIRTSYAGKIADFHAALQLLEKHVQLFRNMITLYSLEDGGKAFKDALDKKVLKPVIKLPD